MSSFISQSFNQDALGDIARPSSYTTGTISALNGTVSITVPEGQSSWDIYLSGTYNSGTTIAFEGSLDNTNWFFLNGRRNTDINTNDQTTLLDVSPAGGSPPTGANPSNWRGVLGGVRFFRARANTFQVGDSVSVQISTSVAVGAVFQNAAAPAFADKMGTGSITTLNGTVVASTNGSSSVVFSVSGTWVATLALQGTVDGTNWTPIAGQIPLGIVTNLLTTNNVLIVPAGGMAQIRLIASAFTSGTAAVAWDSSAGANTLQVFSFTASGMQTTARLNDGVGNAITSTTEGSKIRLDVSTGAALTPSSPTATSVGVTSASALASNSSRKGLVMTNTSTAKISLNLVGGAAVLNSGITLYPGGTWYMDEFTFTTSAIFAIASVAASNLAIQELT